MKAFSVDLIYNVVQQSLVIGAAGYLSLHRLKNGETCQMVLKCGEIIITDGLALGLELIVYDDTIATSDSKGSVTVVKVTGDALEIVSSLAGRGYETWT